ncbi:DUF2071 domain-containing protein [Bacillus sp. N9]
MKIAYQGGDVLYEPEAGTLDHWLLERYCMYSINGKQLYRGDIHHDQWKVTKGRIDAFEASETSFYLKNKADFTLL